MKIAKALKVGAVAAVGAADALFAYLAARATSKKEYEAKLGEGNQNMDVPVSENVESATTSNDGVTE